MKRYTQTLEEIQSSLLPVEAKWLDAHAEEVIAKLQTIPKRSIYGPEDIHRLLSGDFDVGLTLARLFLDCSKDEATHNLKSVLGSGGIGITRYKADPEHYAKALLDLGLATAMTTTINRPLHWTDTLIERLKGGRGSAIKGQQRGRGMEDFVEQAILTVFPKEQIDVRCRFNGANGQSTEKADFAIPSRQEPHILIEVKAYGATGSKQTDVLGDISRIIEQKRHDTVFLLVTDGITWNERLNDLRKIVKLQNEGKIQRVYTTRMRNDLVSDLESLKIERDLGGAR